MTRGYKYFGLISLIISTLIFSCTNSIKKQSKKQTDDKPPTKRRSIKPDFFKIPERAFYEYENGKNGNYFHSLDGSKLYLVPYTDYSITTAILTADSPTEEDIRFLKKEGTRFDKAGIMVDELISEKGIHLGWHKFAVLKTFEKADSVRSDKTSETMYWNFEMQESENDTPGMLSPFVHNGLEFSIVMKFTNDSLRELRYSYEVP